MTFLTYETHFLGFFTLKNQLKSRIKPTKNKKASEKTEAFFEIKYNGLVHYFFSHRLAVI